MPVLDPLVSVPVVELAARIAARDLSPVALVEAQVRRIEAVNGRINALVDDRFAEARSEARKAEALVRSHRGAGLPPLLGVPCTIKEFISVRDMPWTAGLEARRGVRAPSDATVVQRLRDAGAIVLGVSNAPEGGLWMETYNTIYGRTSNPWALHRTPGGSSGGEGALVAAGASPFGIGSDVGGSVRIPAAFCGVPGHKPTGGLVPNTGHHPAAPERGGTYLCTGPIGRTVADLELILGVIAGPDGVDPACVSRFGGPSSVDLCDVTVIPIEHNGACRVRAGVRAAVRNSAQALADQGATLRDGVVIPGLARSFQLWSGMLSEAADDRYDIVLGDGEPIDMGRELLRMATGRSRHTIAGLLLTLGDKLVGALPQDLGPLVDEGKALQADVEAILGDMGVLIYPPYSRPAPRHRDAWRTALDAQYTAIFNVLELPVTVVPVGFDERGLPLAVQIVGSRGQDALTLRVGRALEAAMGRWCPAEPG